MNEKPYTLIENLHDLIGEIPSDSIVSRTFHREDHAKGIVFGFAAGQELSEHTSTQTAIIQIVQGEATVTLGDDRYELSAGAWMYLTPELKHSVYAKTPVIMLLMMFGLQSS